MSTTPSHPAAAPRAETLADAISAAPFDPRRGAHWIVHVGSPLGASLLLHALLLMLFAGVTWVAVRTATSEDDDDAIEFQASIIAEGPSEGPAGGFQFPGHAFLNRPDAAEASSGTPGSAGLADLLKPPDKPVIPQASGLGALSEGLGAAELNRGDIIGIGGAGGALGAAGFSAGLGDRDVAGGGPIGSLWGVGKGQRARSVVYVVDRSGSFVDWVEAIDIELKRSLGLLQEDQSFNIVFLRDNAPLIFRPRMIPADLAAKREAFAWINLHPPAGGSDLTPAVREALKHQPEILFIVTDYALLSSPVQATDLPALIDTIRDANRRGRMTVNVILMGPFARPEGNAENLRRRLKDAAGTLAPQQVSLMREQLELLETLEAIERLPRSTGGTLQYLNGDELMERLRASRPAP